MVFYTVIAVVVLLDQLTKWWVVNGFILYESKEIISGFFNLTYVTNTGAAFGMLAGAPAMWRQLFFSVIGVGALAVIVFFYHKYAKEDRWFGLGLALVGGGALGNLIDRHLLGSVVDFLDFYIGSHHWPAFNVADSAITVGVGILLVVTYRMEKAQNLESIVEK